LIYGSRVQLAGLEADGPLLAALIANEPCDATIDELDQLRTRVFDHLEAHEVALPARDARQLTQWFVDQRARAVAPHRLELERYRIAIRNSTIALYESDIYGVMTWLHNSQLERFAGSMIGRRLNELLSPADSARLDAIEAEVRETGESRALECQIQLGAATRSVFLNFEGRRDANGTIVGFVGSSVDITEPKRAEAELAAALAYRETMLGILGHDLRNPLGAIQGVVGLLALDPNLTAPVKKGLVHVDKATRRMNEMIQTVLDFTRARFHGGFPIQRSAMSFEELCTSVIDEALLASPERTITLATAGDTHGEWDSGRLAQVVANLVGNAVAHGDRESPIALALAGDTAVTLAVSNRGPTLSAALRDRLFDPFTRGSDGLRSGKGLGLGLYIAHQIVAAHAGTIAVDSSDGTTVFTVSLPRA
jgi:PAS domain S-box-containing protein